MSQIIYFPKYKSTCKIGNYSTYKELLHDIIFKNNLDTFYKIYANNSIINNLDIAINYLMNIFICNPNDLILITYNKIEYLIPNNMTISEFIQIYNIEKYIYNSFGMEMFLDDCFTNNGSYYS